MTGAKSKSCVASNYLAESIIEKRSFVSYEIRSVSSCLHVYSMLSISRLVMPPNFQPVEDASSWSALVSPLRSLGSATYPTLPSNFNSFVVSYNR